MKKEEITYNDAISAIEEILERLDDPELDIDLLGKEVKRATELITICREKLRDAAKEVENIIK